MSHLTHDVEQKSMPLEVLESLEAVTGKRTIASDDLRSAN